MDEDDTERLFFLQYFSTWNAIQMVELFQILENDDFFKRKYTVRPRLNPFLEYDESEFKRRYRLSKAQLKKLYFLLDGPRLLEPQVN